MISLSKHEAVFDRYYVEDLERQNGKLWAEKDKLKAENRMLRQLAKADAMASAKIVGGDTAGVSDE